MQGLCARRLPARLLIVAMLAAILLAATVPSDASARARGGRVLAAGDSMIQYVDVALERRLKSRGLRVRSDAHVGTGLSKRDMLDWVRHSRRLARRHRPRATVVFLGANEGFPLRHRGKRVNCCSRGWIRAYARRARAMMRALERGGRSRVYWLTLPAPRPRMWRRIYRSVNRGIEIAAKAERGRGVRVVDTRRVFTPNGRFRRSIRRGGRRVVVRQSDGIHLNRRGAAIAARMVIRAMRRDRVVR